MKEEKMRRRTGWLLTALLAVAVLSPQTGAVAQLPADLVMHTGDVASVEVSAPLRAEVAGGGNVIRDVNRGGDGAVNLTAGEEAGTAEVVFRWLGLVPVRTMTVTVQEPRILIPGGRSLGVAAQTEGVVVVGSSDLGRKSSPAYAAGVRAGDVIQSVNGVPVNASEELSRRLEDGQPVRLGVVRDSEELELDVKPEIDPRDGAYRLGVWVRESTAGVGTLTYYDPETGGYGALGHPITDVDTGILFPVGEGAVYRNTVVGITPGKEGAPGELTGEFFEEETILGEIGRNTEVGIFGRGGEELGQGGLYPDGLPVATRSEVREGPAQLLTTVAGSAVRAYDCEIEKVHTYAPSRTRSMVVRITDEELLEKTGGIVQGMSGSPIIQDGKLVGAVTHVLVNDPTRGYGIFIENMLDTAGEII